MQVQRAQLLAAINDIRASRAAQGTQNVAAPELSKEESLMIQKNFPKTRAVQFDVYQHGGKQISHNPGAKGQIIDFRV